MREREIGGRGGRWEGEGGEEGEEGVMGWKRDEVIRAGVYEGW